MRELSGLTFGIFLLIGLGVFLRRIGLLKFEDRTALNNIIIYVTLPALIFTAARKAPFSTELIEISAVALGISLVAVGFGWLLAKALRLKGPTLGAFLLASGAGNTGYLGYPLTQSLFGRPHLVKAVFYDMFGTVIILFTIGIYFANKYGTPTTSPWRQGMTYAAPNLTALSLGFATQTMQLPAAINLAINSLAGATTGIIMLSIGISLSWQFGRAALPASILTTLKLAIVPTVALGIGVALHLPITLFSIILLQASMPVALMTFVIGDRYDLDRDFLSTSIVLSTLLSMVTIPLWQMIAVALT